MGYYLNFPTFKGIFACPCDIVDRYLNEASPDDLKVLLYILRRNNFEISDEMSDFLGLTHDKIAKSFEFWAQKGILGRQGTQSVSHSVREPQKQAAAAAEPAGIKPASKRVIQPTVSYSSEEITGMAQHSPELKFLLEEASEKLQRMLSAADCSALVYLYSFAGLPADVILMLIEYCVSIGKGNINYIQKTGLGWSDDGIDSHELAEEKIKRLEAGRSYAGNIKAAMGINGRGLTRSELEHIERWHNEYNSSVELATLAYEICVERLGKLSFAYINSILRAWHENGLNDVSQVENFKKNRSKPGKATSYDIDEFFHLSLQQMINSKKSSENK